MSIRTRQACDACSVRKVHCDGGLPCGRCIASSLKCSFLKTRGKPGPKGPRKRTTDAIESLQLRGSSSQAELDTNKEEGLASPEGSSNVSNSLFEISSGHSGSPNNSTDWTQTFDDSTHSRIKLSSNYSRIHASHVAHELKKYAFQAYLIWPVFDADMLVSQLQADPEDMEAYGLATSLCSAFITSFRANSVMSSVAGNSSISATHFEAESIRARLIYEHRQCMTIRSLLTSFFLHVYAVNIGKKSAATLLLTEAITMAHIMGLHKRIYYEELDEDQQQYFIRVYWLLFISERAHAFQNEIPPILHTAADLPPLTLRPDGSISANFIHLCTLFSSLDEAINANSREAIAVAQRRLNQRFLAVASEDNELQRANIVLTQQWMRVFLWQYSLSLTTLFSDDKSEEFSLSFPAQVAKTALEFVSSLSKESLEVHGPGMETKLFEITNSLADVMICVPSLMDGSHTGPSPKDIVNELCKLLATFRGGNPAVLAILEDKLVRSGLMEVGPEEFAKYQDVNQQDQPYYESNVL